MVAGDQSTEVDLDEVTCSQHSVGGPVMRYGRVRSSRDDRLERCAVGAVHQHQRFEVVADLLLGAARAQPARLHQVRQRGIGGLAGQPQHRQLAGILHFAQSFDGSGRPDQLATLPCLACERGEGVDGHHVALEAEPAHSGGGGAPDQMRIAGALDHHLGVGSLTRGLGAVAAVGGQHRRFVFGEHQQRRVGAGEPGQITHVDQVRYQHGIQSGIHETLP